MILDQRRNLSEVVLGNRCQVIGVIHVGLACCGVEDLWVEIAVRATLVEVVLTCSHV